MKKYDLVDEYITGLDTTPVSSQAESLKTTKSVGKKVVTEKTKVEKTSELVSTSKQISKLKKTKFNPDNVKKIIDLQLPRRVRPGSKFTKSMSIEVGYLDQSGKKRVKTVYFGDPKRSDYIDHKSDELRERFLKASNKPQHEFQSSFYENFLLNGKHKELMQNYDALRSLMLTEK